MAGTSAEAGRESTRPAGRRASPPARGIFLVATLALVAACAPPATSPATPTPGVPIASALAVETFDSAWSRVNRTYYDTTFHGLDWDSVRVAFRPRAAAARTVVELRSTIDEMLGLLGESHFAVVAAESADALAPDSIAGANGEPGDVGVELRVVEGRLLVFRVEPDGPADRAGVRTGWALEAIDTLPTARLLDVLDDLPGERRLAEARVAWAAESRLAGRVGDTLRVRFRTGSGESLERLLVSRPEPGTAVRFGNLPTLFSRLERQEVPAGDRCVGVIRFNVWMTPILPPFEDAFLALSHCDGTVIDLRGNPGGVAGMIMGVSGYFMDETRPLGRMITRQSELKLVTMPRRVTRTGEPMEPDARPLALIVDGQSMSTSELFAAGLQAIGRARVFGQTSGGQALPAMMARLPNRDVLMYVFANYLDPGGDRIEGRGVVPDRPVPLTQEDLLQGRDAALEAAIRWIEASSSPITR